jgi:hypothetical protein
MKAVVLLLEAIIMNDSFTTRVQAAAVAGWWTVLIGVGFATLLWVISLTIMFTRPAWVLSMCGPDVSWYDVQHICLWAIVAFKFCLWMLALVVVWLTLWGRQLRKRSGTG